ncbi:MAG: hypothetical protein WD733_20800 [Bryobacterales bacterium]
MKKLSLLFVSLALAVWMGCSGAGEADETASVRQAVERYLSARTDLSLSSMRVVVNKVTVEGERATAAVTIAASNDPQAKMEIMYNLRKTAQGWEVEPPQGGAAGAHGGSAPKPEAGGESMPPGHPPVGGETAPGAAELPPGHPPVEN